MSQQEIVLVGGGGHCRSCIDVIECQGLYKIAGIIDQSEKVGQTVLNYPIIGSDDDLSELTKQHKNFLITLGQIKSSQRREEVYRELKSFGAHFPVVTSPLAHVSKHAQVAEGSIIMHRVIVNAGASIGVNCIINTASVIEHDVKIGDHCHISTGSIVNGGSQIGSNTFVGSKSVIKEDVHIADHLVVGSGAVVVQSLQETGTYVGNPTRKVS